MTTRAILIASFDDPPHLAEIDVPDLAPDQVLIRVRAASLNAFDWKVADGVLKHAFTYDFPVTIGRDYAGVVEEVGDHVERVSAGDAVVGYFAGQTLKRGSFADRVWCSEDECFVQKPEGLTFPEASCLPLSGMTARRCVDAVEAAAGQHHVVIGAAGGIGSFAIQLLAASGAYVIATGLPEDAEYLRGLGASEVIDHRAGLVEVLRARYPHGIEGILDLVSYSADFMEHVTVLRQSGRAVSLHRAADPEKLEPLGVTGINVQSAPDQDLLASVVAAAATGQLSIPLQSVVPLEEAPRALAQLRDQHTRGKHALVMEPT